MFRRVIVLVLLALVTLINAVGALAAPNATPAAQSEWYAYVFDNNTQRLMRIYADGRQEFFDFKRSETTFVSGYDMVFATDGLVAHCYLDTSLPSDNPLGTFPASFIVRDLNTNTEITNVPLGQVISCRATRFSADNQLVAVSLIYAFPLAEGGAPQGPLWELMILDRSGQMVARLPGDSALLQTVEGLNLQFPISPEVRWFEGNTLIFASVPFATDAFPEFAAGAWNYVENTMTDAASWGRFAATAYGREVVWGAYDTSLPAAQTPIGLSINVVKGIDANGAERTLYHSPDWLIGNLTFVNGGTQLAMFQFPGFDPDNPPQGEVQTRLLLLGRDGSTQTMMLNGYAELRAAPDGFVLLSVEYDSAGGASVYALDYYREGQPARLWSADGNALSWTLLWTLPQPPADDLPDFPTFAQ